MFEMFSARAAGGGGQAALCGAGEVLMFGSYGAGDLDPKALKKLIVNQCLRPLYCTLGTGSCKP